MLPLRQMLERAHRAQNRNPHVRAVICRATVHHLGSKNSSHACHKEKGEKNNKDDFVADDIADNMQYTTKQNTPKMGVFLRVRSSDTVRRVGFEPTKS